ncbi:hypothetical protein WDU94_015566 [Cyamophila willieti]
MSQQQVTARSLYTRKKNELRKVVQPFDENRDTDITSQNVVLLRSLRDQVQTAFDLFLEKKQELEGIVPNEADRVRTILPEDEDLELSIWCSLQTFRAKLLQFETNDERRREEQAAAEALRREEQAAAEALRREEQVVAEALRRHEEAAAETRHRREMERRELEHQIVRSELEYQVRREAACERPTTVQQHVNNLGHLPKISLLKYGGDRLGFIEFWENFDSLINSRADIDTIQKFHYLKGQLFGKAAEKLAGIRVCGDNYETAVNILKSEFGSKSLILATLYQEIAKMNPVSYKPSDVLQFYSDLEVKFKLIENQGSQLSFDNTLKHMVFCKLSTTTKAELAKQYGSDISIEHVRAQMISELTTARVLDALDPQNFKSQVQVYNRIPSQPTYDDRMYSTKTMIRNEAHSNHNQLGINCIYCDVSHYPDDCDRYPTLAERKERVRDRCYICLSQTHFFRNCPKQNKYCYYCKAVGKHHRSLCPRPLNIIDLGSKGSETPFLKSRSKRIISDQFNPNVVISGSSCLKSGS